MVRRRVYKSETEILQNKSFIDRLDEADVLEREEQVQQLIRINTQIIAKANQEIAQNRKDREEARVARKEEREQNRRDRENARAARLGLMGIIIVAFAITLAFTMGCVWAVGVNKMVLPEPLIISLAASNIGITATLFAVVTDFHFPKWGQPEEKTSDFPAKPKREPSTAD